MSRGKGTSLTGAGTDTNNVTVKHFYQNAKAALELRVPLNKTGFKQKIDQQCLEKDSSTILIWSQPEIRKFLRLNHARRKSFLAKKLGENVLFIIIAEGMDIPEEIVQNARDKDITLFSSSAPVDTCRLTTANVLSQLFSRQVVIPGGLLQVHGLGVLIIGDSGIGKSESALELIARGSRFVSDDVTQVEKDSGDKLIGSAPDLTRDFMEVRGLSIINIKQIFGSKSVSRKSEIDLVIQLKRWEKGKKYDRLGLEVLKNYKIMGVKVPMVSIPVAPGRNIAALIEVACKVQILRKKGYHAPEEIVKKLDRALSLR